MCVFLAAAPLHSEEAQVAQVDLPKAILRLGRGIAEVQVADDDLERSTGLMFRDTLGENEGMLFVFDRPNQTAFWMKNTRVPLSIAYINSSGRILDIYDLKPYDETTVPSRFDSVLYALEMPSGWFAKHGVLAGDLVEGLPRRKP